MNKTVKARARLLRTAASVAVLSAVVATNGVYAQEEETEELLELEEIVITGTRLKKNPMDFAAPVMGVDSDDVKFSGNPDLGQFLQELPALSGGSGRTSFSDSDENGNEGLSLANLRGLGSGRTLVLVNGKRHVGGTPSSLAVDLSTIPTALVKNVEILTGGASAVYGSDAVTGVVNFILDDEFEGVQIDANRNARLEGSEGSSYQFSITAGTGFADDKGHLTFSASRDHTDMLMARDQPFRNSTQAQRVANPVAGDGEPDSVIVPNVYWDILSPNGVLGAFGTGGPLGLTTFNDAGTAMVPFPATRDGFQSGGLTNAHNGRPFGTFSFEDFLTVVPESDKTVLTTSVKYELDDNLEIYGDIKYVKGDFTDISQPEQLVFSPINVAQNPFLPDDARQALTDAGITTAPLLKSLNQLEKREEVERETLRFVGGLEGTFDSSFADVDYDFYYIFGRTDNTVKQVGERVDANRNLAVDAVTDVDGSIVCRFNADPSVQGAGYNPVAAARGTLNPTACAPLNPFGLATASQAALDFISAEAVFTDRIEQEVIGFNFVSDSSKFLTLPAGAIDFAGGIEYREETVSREADELSIQGIITSNVSTENFPAAGYDVTEAFLEMSVPLVADMPGIDSLTLDGAVRVADYSHAGRNTAWKWGLNWAIIPDLRIRGTVSQAVRAPNVTEAFSPVTIGTAAVNDLCDADDLALEPAGSPVAANCAALGVPVGFEQFEGLQIDLASGGNEDLDPEVSDSYTVGFVYEPEFIEGMNLQIDYWNIEIEDAINAISAQTLLDTCLRSPGGNGSDPTCGAIQRNTDPNHPQGRPVGGVTAIKSGPINIASLEASGWDLNLTYATELFDKPFRAKALYSKLIKNTNFPFQNDPTTADPRKGELGFPDQKLVLSVDYDFGPVAMRWEGRYISSQILYDRPFETSETVAPGETGSIFYNDLFVEAPIPGYEGSNVYLGVNNLLDEDDLNFRSVFFDGRGQYDQLGRTIVAGFRISL